MAKAIIYSVNFELPGDELKYVSFNSRTSLLDADIIVFRPTLEYGGYIETYLGKPKLNESSSTRNRESTEHWRRELAEAYKHGKTILVFLEAPITVYIDTGEKQYSGTGRTARVTNIVTELGSYASIPLTFDRIVQSQGRGIKRAKDGRMLDAFWRSFGPVCRYEIHYELKAHKPLLLTNSGDKVVGSILRKESQGVMLLLPPLDLDYDSLTYLDQKTNETYWTKDAIKLAKQLIGRIVELHKTLRSRGEASPPPSWIVEPSFALRAEGEFQARVADVERKIAGLLEQKDELEKKLEDASSLKGLLYETGKPLENAIRKALRILGFTADGYRDAESEFDVVFEAPEGRFIGEAEGKDSAAVNIDKLQQLERNIQEDYAKTERAEFASGVMFGNAKRLSPPADRGDFFTEKCLTAAARTGIVLVKTPDLFLVARYVDESGSQEFARVCREALRDSKGAIAVFPQIPGKDSNHA